MIPATGVLARAACSPRRLRSTLLIGLVVGLAATALAASIIVRGAATDRVDAAFTRGGGADLVLYIAPAAEGALHDALAADPRVVGVGQPLPSIAAALDDHDRTSLEVRAMPPNGSLNSPVITEGRAPAAGAETLFDAALASDAGIRVGDEIRIVTGGVNHTLDVVGLGYDFTDCLYPQCDPAHLWVSGTSIAVLTSGVRATMVPVDLIDPSAAAPVVNEVRARLGDALLGSNDWPDTRRDLLVVTDFFGAFLGAFGLFVLVASAVVIAGAIAAQTMARRRTIALYKAVGFTGRQLTRAVLLEHVVIALVASLAGWVVATLLSPILRVGPLRLLESGRIDWNASALVVTSAVTTLIVAMATLLPAWRAGRVDITSALAGDGRPARRDRRRGSGTHTADMPLPLAFALAAITSRPVRAGCNVLAIVIAVVAAIVSFSIIRSVDVVMLDPALAGDPADVELEPADTYAPADAARLLDHTPGVRSWYSFADDTASIAGGDVHLRAVGGDPATTGFVVGAGRLPERTGEAAAGYGLLRERGWQLGDRVTIELSGNVSGSWFDVELVGWYRESEDSGEVLQVRMEDYERAAGDVRPEFGVIAGPATTTDALSASLTDEFGAGSSIRPNVPDDSGVRPFRVALGAMTLLIASVAAAHVAASTLTAQRESRRRQGTQRALGWQPSQSLAECLVHGSILAAAALVIAIPLGWVAQRALGDLLTSEIGIGPGLAFGPTPVAMAIIALATLTLGALATAAAVWPSLRRPPDALLREE